MTILNRLYASSGSEVIIDTLQINIGGEVLYLCDGYDDITAINEAGDTVTFIASAIAVALPARNSDGTQDLQFAVGNINGEASTAIRDAMDNLTAASITYRRYTSNDLSAPAERPFTLAIKSGNWTAVQANFTAGYMNILDTAWPRYRYTLPLFPGLRYIS